MNVLLGPSGCGHTGYSKSHRRPNGPTEIKTDGVPIAYSYHLAVGAFDGIINVVRVHWGPEGKRQLQMEAPLNMKGAPLSTIKALSEYFCVLSAKLIGSTNENRRQRLEEWWRRLGRGNCLRTVAIQ